MQVTIEETTALERRMTVRVPATEVDDRLQERLRKLGRTVRLKGFRPGKVPLNVIRQRYGSKVREEVVEEVIQTTLRQALTERELQVAAVPELKTLPAADGDQDLHYTARVEVFPRLDDIELAKITIRHPTAEVGDGDVDQMIETLREQRRPWDAAGRPAAAGDRIMFDYRAALSSGDMVPPAGHRRVTLILGQGHVFAALEVALTGMSEGEEKSLSLDFPEDFRDPELAGRTADITLTVRAVQCGELPALDDAFCRAFGVIEGGVERLRAEVRENLERERNAAVRRLRRRRVVEALVARYQDLDLPPSLIRSEAQKLQAEIERQTRAMQGDRHTVPSAEELAPLARRRVLASFLLGELGRRQGIEADPGRVGEAVQEIASTYENPEEVVNLYFNDLRLMESVRREVREEQIIDWLVEQVDSSSEPLTFATLIEESRRG